MRKQYFSHDGYLKLLIVYSKLLKITKVTNSKKKMNVTCYFEQKIDNILN